MTATRPRVQQLHQSGATPSQVLTWTGTVWAPADPSGGGIRCRAALTAVGGERVLYLNASPVLNTDQVFVNGLRKVWGGVDYTLTGTAIVFVSALTAGQVVVIDYETTAVCGVASLGPLPTAFKRPAPLRRLAPRLHRVR